MLKTALALTLTGCFASLALPASAAVTRSEKSQLASGVYTITVESGECHRQVEGATRGAKHKLWEPKAKERSTSVEIIDNGRGLAFIKSSGYRFEWQPSTKSYTKNTEHVLRAGNAHVQYISEVQTDAKAVTFDRSGSLSWSNKTEVLYMTPQGATAGKISTLCSGSGHWTED